MKQNGRCRSYLLWFSRNSGNVVPGWFPIRLNHWHNRWRLGFHSPSYSGHSEDHEMIEANNKGRPVYLLKGHLLHDCFDNIAHRLLGHKRAFAKCKRRGLLSRIFLG